MCLLSLVPLGVTLSVVLPVLVQHKLQITLLRSCSIFKQLVSGFRQWQTKAGLEFLIAHH